jgi:branched-chain amino acid transport system ATP-binding protein
MNANAIPDVKHASILEVQGLTKRFGGLMAIRNVSFEVAPRMITALIGPNGAGKTTIFNLITNVITVDQGHVSFLGQNLRGLSAVGISAKGLIRTFQSARVFPGMTALENVMIGCHRLASCHVAGQMLWLPCARAEERRIRAHAMEMLELAGLSRFAGTHAIELPMGAQKLLEVIRALMARPKLLCLDEPAAGLNDRETQELANLLRAIRDVGISVLLVEHNMSLVMNVANDIVVLDAGTVIARGSPSVIQRDPTVIGAYLGLDADAAS